MTNTASGRKCSLVVDMRRDFDSALGTSEAQAILRRLSARCGALTAR